MSCDAIGYGSPQVLELIRQAPHFDLNGYLLEPDDEPFGSASPCPGAITSESTSLSLANRQVEGSTAITRIKDPSDNQVTAIGLYLFIIL